MITIKHNPDHTYLFSSSDDSYGVGEIIPIGGKDIIAIKFPEGTDSDEEKDLGRRVEYRREGDDEDNAELPFFDLLEIQGNGNNIRYLKEPENIFTELNWNLPS